MNNGATPPERSTQAPDAHAPLLCGEVQLPATDTHLCSEPPPSASEVVYVMQRHNLLHPLLAHLTAISASVSWMTWCANAFLNSKSLIWPVSGAWNRSVYQSTLFNLSIISQPRHVGKR